MHLKYSSKLRYYHCNTSTVGKKGKKPKAAESVSKPGVSEESPGPSKIKTVKPEENNLDSREKKANSAPKSAGGSCQDNRELFRKLVTQRVMLQFPWSEFKSSSSF